MEKKKKKKNNNNNKNNNRTTTAKKYDHTGLITFPFRPSPFPTSAARNIFCFVLLISVCIVIIITEYTAL